MSKTLRSIVSGRAVYLAAPKKLFGEPAYRKAVERLQRLGAALVIGARESFADNSDWLSHFPEILRQVAAVVVLLPWDRVIGAGVLREIADARAAGIPVFFLELRRRRAHGLRTAVFEIPDVDASHLVRVRFPHRYRGNFRAMLRHLEWLKLRQERPAE
jgi:hypothetical protein